MADMKTGIIYARYSDKKQDDGFSIDAQINAIKEYAISSNIEIKQIFVDQAVSGTSKDRKQLNEALKYCQEHKVHCFLVHKYDRFARNRYDSIIMKKNLSESGTEVVSITQQKTGESSDVLLESLYDGMAEYYSKNLKEEVLKGMVEAASQGYWVGGVAPFGYSIEKKDNKSKLVPNDNSATVKQIYNHYMHDDIGYKNMAKMYKLSVKQIT
ncbi:MAG TPA: recombinase, partial [Xanthomarina gelatinilytica]|nr:recombinase [Xanthomarina gelatinilytica]